MTENLKKFMEKVSNDEKLKKELKSLSLTKSNYVEKISEFAKKIGFNLTKEDFKNDKYELSNKELYSISAANGNFVFGYGRRKDWDCECSGCGDGVVI